MNRDDHTTDPVTVLEVEDLHKHYPVRAGLLRRKVAEVKAVDGVGFEIRRGETLGLAGESGCGKTTLVRTIARLVAPTRGRVRLRTQAVPDHADDQSMVEISSLPAKHLKAVRREMQVVFQDPDSSLNPRLTIRATLTEPMVIHRLGTRNQKRDRVAELLEMVGLDSSHMNRFPHELSGGQKQRVGIARALAVGPRLLVADEPVSALDVSVQAQILNLLMDLQGELGLTYLFIAHDLAVIGHVSSRVAVMYLGRIVEMATRAELFCRPLHPYTVALLAAAQTPDPHRKPAGARLAGEVPSPVDPPPGCHFHTRCIRVMPVCRRDDPARRQLDGDHLVYCHLYD